jgi:hypothetical protein
MLLQASVAEPLVQFVLEFAASHHISGKKKSVPKAALKVNVELRWMWLPEWS